MVDFPNTPQDGDTHIENGTQWVYRSPPGAWAIVGGSPVSSTEIVDDFYDTNAVAGDGHGWFVIGDTLVQYGRTRVTGDGSGNFNPVTVTLPQAYDNSDYHIATSAITSSDAYQKITCHSLNPTDFTLEVARTSTTNTVADWHTIGPAPERLKKPKEVDSAGGAGIPGGPLQIVEDALIPDNEGYQVVGSILVQWGQHAITPTQTNVMEVWPVDLPTAFKDTNYAVMANTRALVTQVNEVGGRPLSTTQLELGYNRSTTTTGSVNWIAIGEAPDDMKLSKAVAGAGGGDTGRSGAKMFFLDSRDISYSAIPSGAIIAIGSDGFESYGPEQVVRFDGVGQCYVTKPGRFRITTTLVAVADSGQTARQTVYTLPAGKGGDNTAHYDQGRQGSFYLRNVTGARAGGANSVVEVDLVEGDLIQHAVEIFSEDGSNCAGIIRGTGTSTLIEYLGPRTIKLIDKEVMEFHDPTNVGSWRIVGNTLECWGKDVGTGGDGQQVNFPKTFAREPTVMATPSVNAGTGRSITVFGQTTTGFQYDHRTTNTDTFVGNDVSWHAIGEWDGT